ncbi:hypothetical protein [Novosphingobium sp. SG707]|uniref:hypothetical protein n=1 Tax=Novosphingobium sp. SG707 TaxID=2586996 RepID=UPI001445FAA4|nr:hypothetical protein [Novosphingobium sp. SG707]NKJ03020.1 hypothetical protein [Novosphingobium sp. SG707]
MGIGIFAQPVTGHAASRSYQIIWAVNPIEQSMEEKTVEPGDVIARAKLVPPTLLALEGDAVGENGKTIIPHGSQMIALRADVLAACTFTFRPVDPLQGFLFGNGQRFTCFVDQNRDGKFDSIFYVVSNKIGVPSSFGTIPRTLKPIVPVAYRRSNPSDGADFPTLLFKYSHQDKITGHSYFGICIENPSTHKQTFFDGYSGVRSDKLPKKIGTMGVEAIATKKNGDKIELVVKSGFSSAEFAAEESVSLTFY